MSYSVLTVFDDNGNAIPIPAIKGEPGKDGQNGSDYILTEADKQEIANIALAKLPTAEGVSY